MCYRLNISAQTDILLARSARADFLNTVRFLQQIAPVSGALYIMILDIRAFSAFPVLVKFLPLVAELEINPKESHEN